MHRPAIGFILLFNWALACSDSSDSKPTPPPEPDCTVQNTCEPALKIWSPTAQAILLEKPGGPYSKAELVPGLYLERKEMTEAQVKALDQWAILSESDALKCSADSSDLAYKAVIFDEEGGKHVYYGMNNPCGEPGQNARFVPLSYFQDFPGDIPYRPNAAGDYVIEKVVVEGSTLKVNVKHTDGCASFRNFTLMVDAKVSDSSPPVIEGYIRHRTDNDCEALGRSRLEFDLKQYNFRNAGLMKLKGWTKRQVLPVQKLK